MTIVELKEYIYNNNKVEFVLESIGCGHVKLNKNKNYYTCSNKDGDNNNAIVVYNTPYLNTINHTRDIKSVVEDKNIKFHTDIITLVQYCTNQDFYNSIKYLHKILDIPFISTDKKQSQIIKNDPLSVFTKHTTRTKIKVNEFDYSLYDDNIIKGYMPYLYIDWVKEGITERARDKFNIGYSFERKRIVIPHRIWNGNDNDYIGIMGRTTVPNYDLFGISKYFPFISYQKSINIYGLQENYSAIKNAKRVVVFESEKSVLKRYSKFDETAVAIMGCNISEEQIRILIGLDVDIIFAFDKGVSLQHIKNVCGRFCGLRNIYYMYDKWDLLEDKMSPADAKEKIYEFLMKFKIKF